MWPYGGQIDTEKFARLGISLTRGVIIGMRVMRRPPIGNFIPRALSTFSTSSYSGSLGVGLASAEISVLRDRLFHDR